MSGCCGVGEAGRDKVSGVNRGKRWRRRCWWCYLERLAVVNDLLPGQAQAAWYQMRLWIEDEYQDHQRGGFHWEHTKMRDPGRAERLYLAMAVTMQIAVMVGGSLEVRTQQEQRRKKTQGAAQRRRRGRG